MQSISTMLYSCKRNTMTMIKNFSTLMCTLLGSLKQLAARSASTSIMMRNTVWQPLYVSMQSGTTLSKSSKSATISSKTLAFTKVKLVVDFGVVIISAMEVFAELMMSACLAVVVLSYHLHTIDVCQCWVITAQAWTHLV